MIVLRPDDRLAALVDEAVARRRGRARRRRRRRLARRRGRSRARARAPVRLRSRRHPQPLRARRRRRPRRSGRLARRVHRRRRAPDRRGRGERPPLPQQRLARDLRRRGSAAGLPRRQGAHARCRRPRRCSDRARRQPAWSSWTTAAAPIATPPSCSSRTTPTRSSRRVRPAPGRRSTAGGSAIVVLDRPAAGQSPGRTWTATQLEVTATAPVHAGIDGEAVELDPPLGSSSGPRALRVRISSRHATVKPERRSPPTLRSAGFDRRQAARVVRRRGASPSAFPRARRHRR